MDNIDLGKRIKEARTRKKLTQEQLAEKADIGSYNLGEVERGVKAPSLKVFVSIADALGVSADALLCDSAEGGSVYLNNEISRLLDSLTPKQRAGALEILKAYVAALK